MRMTLECTLKSVTIGSSPPLGDRLDGRAIVRTIPKGMRYLLICVFLAACASSPEDNGPGEPLPLTRVVYRQYYRGSHPFVMENLAGRDLVELRSRTLKRGESPVAYVPDDKFVLLLEEFEKADLGQYLTPRPADPTALGAIGELSITDARGTTRSFLRTKSSRRSADPRAYQKRHETYTYCVKSFLAVWNAYHPEAQAVAGTKDEFGVRRVDVRDR
jgi:hypothetical protein